MTNIHSSNQKLNQGTYEIIQNRLRHQSNSMAERLRALNAARKEVFASESLSLIANQRITTENNGIARGIFALGDLCIFAYNVHFGLREDIQLSDVFSVYRFKDNSFDPQDLSVLNDEQFVADFTNLYKYYRDAIFAKFKRTEHYLYMVFQTSAKTEDRKAFKWLIKDNALQYIDDRSVHEAKDPEQHSFKWVKTTLEDRRLGLYPHVSILDKLFIEAIGGDITFKIEDNTDSGKGIYSEPVKYPDQQLDDADYYYADLGNIIAIKIRPYQEEERTYIFNVRTRTVVPVPSLLHAAVALPDSQGLIFSNGYYLQTGTAKIFEAHMEQLQYVRTIASPNGEDFLYVFYEAAQNTYVLMSYNVIQQDLATPIICNGYTVFDDGKLIYFKSAQEAVRHHQVQIWQTPYTKMLRENNALVDNVLYKIGNKDIVRAMAELNEIVLLAQKEDSYEGLYEDIEQKSSTVLDAYFWIGEAATFNLAEPLKEIRNIANAAIDEFARVQEQRTHALHLLQEAQQQVAAQALEVRNLSAQSLDELVQLLAKLRQQQGRLIDLQSVRYIDTHVLTTLQSELQQYNAQVSADTIDFLLTEQALSPYEQKVEHTRARLQEVKKVIEGQDVEGAIKAIASELELLVDVINSLKIEDTTHTTKIVEKIALIFASLNELKAELARRINELKTQEAVGSFYAQMTLLDQTLVNYMDLADSPEKAEDYYTKISVQVEEMESRFADFPEFIAKIADKRDELATAFNARKEQLQAQRNRRVEALEQIAQRILRNVEHKAFEMEQREEIFSFFASDLMIEKLRNLVSELKEMGDVAKAEQIETTLRLTHDEALRQLKDRKDLFVDGAHVIALGEHKFLANKQTLNLAIVRRSGRLFYHLMGTSFYKEVQEDRLYRYQSVWDQELVAENEQVYRAEYLAYKTLEAGRGRANFDAETYINQQTERDFAAGYLKGVHNVDAFKIYQVVAALEQALGVLRFTPVIRVSALYFWKQQAHAERDRLLQLIHAAHRIHQSFSITARHDYISAAVSKMMADTQVLHAECSSDDIAAYLYAELSQSDTFTLSAAAVQLKRGFEQYLHERRRWTLFFDTLHNEALDLYERFIITQSWLSAYFEVASPAVLPEYVDELAMVYLSPELHFRESSVNEHFEVSELRGSHPILQEQTYAGYYHRFCRKMQEYCNIQVPAFQEFNAEKARLVQAYQQELKISEFEPKVLGTFIRNRLINEVYFPLIGSNLAKQIGTVGNDKRSARMGMLLLISPPGYGKTTLMEYLAKIMGLHFVKINGPAIGHGITSIDPAEATTSGAREELKKINLALEMADNIMLYVDDIQHCSAEFLQKFISLADGQRKMEGVFEGESRTYDLRGKRFCIIMAGNPYTESGELFRLPDMLANRADVYNLGDVVGNSAHLFRLSLLENALAENPYLHHVAVKSMDDFYKLVTYVEQEQDILPELESNLSTQELEDAIAVLRHALVLRSVVLQVNKQYIASAAMRDEYRLEPPFKLQGSYRNMNRMVSSLVPLMNEQEVKDLMLAHYERESQTLTADAEANMLKLKEIMGIMSQADAERWAHICQVFATRRSAGDERSQAMAQLVANMQQMGTQLSIIAQALQQ